MHEPSSVLVNGEGYAPAAGSSTSVQLDRAVAEGYEPSRPAFPPKTLTFIATGKDADGLLDGVFVDTTGAVVYKGKSRRG